MGLFGSSTPVEPTPKVAPNRSQRARCWEARDAFFTCLDANSIIDSIKEAKKASGACRTQELAFEKECTGSWVEYFKKKRVMEINRATMLEGLRAEGANQIEMPDPKKPTA